MATYAAERPENLEAALRSVIDQSLAPEEVVLVLDGPLMPSHEAVLGRLSAGYPLRIVRLTQQAGLARALNAGLPYCRSEWIARMDSDDLSVHTRFERQAGALADDPSIDLLASWHVEFDEDPEQKQRVKLAPARHQDIARWLKWRNVLSHPTIVVRRSVLEAAGGYRPVHLLEDWDLYLRLLRGGARFAVLQEPLVKVRAARHARRRGGLRYFVGELRFRCDCLRRGDIGVFEFVVLTVGYAIWRLTPTPVRRLLYPLARASAGEAA